jgi:Putative DNA-binding domain
MQALLSNHAWILQLGRPSRTNFDIRPIADFDDPRKPHYDAAMNAELFESLLYQAESETLDFKVDQYPFEAATDVQKSELLKDILAFANAWRRSDAYILIGVEEVRGGRSIVRGLSKQLLNHSLQQFVHSKTNKAMSFNYEELQVEGLPVAAITIPLQERPVYLTKDFGRLRANAVYIRRGDSTGEAPPDEMVKMAQAGIAADSQPSLNLEFADLPNRKTMGTTAQLATVEFRMPDPDSIPDYGRVGHGSYVLPAAVSGNNSDYLREVAEYLSTYGRFQPIGFAVRNASTAAAINVVLRMRVSSEFVEVRSQEDMPEEPSRTWLARIRPAAPFLPKSRVTVSNHSDFYDVRIDIGTIQPGITEFSPEPIFLGAPEPFDLSLEAVLSGDNVRVPIVETLAIQAQSESREISISDLRKFGG